MVTRVLIGSYIVLLGDDYVIPHGCLSMVVIWVQS